MGSIPWLELAWTLPLGFCVGALGTLVGAGGGFVLVPVLLFLYPEMNAEIVTSISLAVVFFNALAGSLSYARMKRIDYRTGLIFSSATVPGAMLGAVTTKYIPREAFHLLFGLLLLSVAAFLWLRPHRAKALPTAPRDTSEVRRVFHDAAGNCYDYSYKPWRGVVLSAIVGYLSSLLGIGGGIIHVPALVSFLNFPVHVATATSHFMLAIMTLAGTAVHLTQGKLTAHLSLIGGLSCGVILGAPFGARLSGRFGDTWIIRCLALGLILVGFRLIFLR